MQINNSEIHLNGAVSGAGLYIANSPNITINNSIINDNQNILVNAENKGAGIYIDGSNITILNSSFRGNQALTAPAIFARSAQVKLSNVLVSGNYFTFTDEGATQTYPGGAIYSTNSDLSIINSS